MLWSVVVLGSLFMLLQLVFFAALLWWRDHAAVLHFRRRTRRVLAT